MTDMVPFQFDLPLGEEPSNEELGAAYGVSLPILSLRGGRWHVRHGDEEVDITDERGNAAAAIEVVIVAASPYTSRSYYAERFSGDNEGPPDCFSLNGATPDGGVDNPQADECRTCPRNVFKPGVGYKGKAGRECRINKRLIVAFADDLRCKVFGSPLLLVLPTMSLQNLNRYKKQLAAAKAPYWACVTELSFVPSAEYPIVRFRPVRALTLDEVRLVDAARSAEGVSDAIGVVPDPLPLPSSDSADTVERPTKKQPAKKRATKKAAPPPPPPQVDDDDDGEEDYDFDAVL